MKKIILHFLLVSEGIEYTVSVPKPHDISGIDIVTNVIRFNLNHGVVLTAIDD